jgi:hypothetical protein
MQSSPADPAQELAQACHTLWLSTLALMTAYMRNPAPAHRLLLARRIAKNFDTLQQQGCFAQETRMKFGSLARRWQRNADRHSPTSAEPPGVLTRLQRLFAR